MNTINIMSKIAILSILLISNAYTQTLKQYEAYYLKEKKLNIIKQKLLEQKQESDNFIEILNSIRLNPIDNPNIKYTFDIKKYVHKMSKIKLKYSEKLSIDCYTHAKYLAENKLIGHSNFMKNESVGYAKSLIIDMLYQFMSEKHNSSKEYPDGHRQHLLSSNNKDSLIGIAFEKNDGYTFIVIQTE